MSAPPSAPQEQVPQYYRWLRDDILRHVPQSVRTVLSIGCGGAETEAELVKRGVAVTGIEADPAAAALARSRGVQVIEGDALDAIARVTSAPLDCLICADVLEHLSEPAEVLARGAALLRPGGVAVVSVPNYRHHEVLWQLAVRGHVHHTSAGILDRTHRQMTTRRLAAAWLRDAGLAISAREYRVFGRRDGWLSRLLLGLADEFLAKQIILVGRKDEDGSLQSEKERGPPSSS